jgi:cobalamin biosynthesis Mg chelatase CobN
VGPSKVSTPELDDVDAGWDGEDEEEEDIDAGWGDTGESNDAEDPGKARLRGRSPEQRAALSARALARKERSRAKAAEKAERRKSRASAAAAKQKKSSRTPRVRSETVERDEAPQKDAREDQEVSPRARDGTARTLDRSPSARRPAWVLPLLAALLAVAIGAALLAWAR